MNIPSGDRRTEEEFWQEGDSIVLARRDVVCTKLRVRSTVVERDDPLSGQHFLFPLPRPFPLERLLRRFLPRL